jgi:histidine triad (HIT) family protein
VARIVDFRANFWYIQQVFFTSHDPIDVTAHCAFCQIIRGESAAHTLYENDHAIAILDINPIHFGHVLVIPKTHAATYIDVPRAELADLAHAMMVVSRAIVDALGPPGFNIFSNNGRAAGQSVFHFHFHVTPRYEDDNIKFILTLKKYSGREMHEYAERIRRSILPALSDHQ